MNLKTILFQAIQFSLSMQFTSVCPIDRTLSGAITPSYSRLGSDGNEGVPIPQNLSITGTSPLDCFVSYPGHLLSGGSYASAEVQSVYSTALADWATFHYEENEITCNYNRLYIYPVPWAGCGTRSTPQAEFTW